HEYDSFPLELKLFDNDLYVLSTTSQHKYLLASKLVSINGVSSLDVVRLLSEISPFSENEFSTAIRAAGYFTNAAVLSGLGIVENEDEAKFVFDVQGEKREINLELDRKSTRLNSSHVKISYAVFCLKKKYKSLV